MQTSKLTKNGLCCYSEQWRDTCALSPDSPCSLLFFEEIRLIGHVHKGRYHFYDQPLTACLSIYPGMSATLVTILKYVLVTTNDGEQRCFLCVWDESGLPLDAYLQVVKDITELGVAALCSEDMWKSRLQDVHDKNILVALKPAKK